MYILAFETSCDDTSVALLQDGYIVALSTRTQLEHNVTGGVVPEVAARSHANAIFPCIDDVLAESKVALSEIDYFACTEKPGLMPSLLTGIIVAKTLSTSLHKPLVYVDHIEGHIFANFLERDMSEIVFPSIVLTVSGGHTELYIWRALFDIECIGQTRDDAAGECFDKVGKMLGLGFPAGAQIAKLSEQFLQQSSVPEQESAYHLFPRGLAQDQNLEFSFSGMKSAIKRYIDEQKTLTEEHIKMIAYATESAIIDTLSSKALQAMQQHHIIHLCLAGGVSANTRLKKTLEGLMQAEGYNFLAPVKNIYSMDNAAMIAMRAHMEVMYRKQ